VVTTPDRRTMFVNVQHPGETIPFWGGAPTPDNPRLVSNWPDFDPAGRPRSATVVVRRKDGGVIGT
jgi:secreted PhoX family phosphatase